MASLCYRRHRFPPEVIQHAIWLYLRFTLSYRDVDELLAERGLDISYENVRSWVLKLGPVVARQLTRRRPRPSNRWHLDEMVARIAGKRMCQWRAVDHEGEVLDMLVQSRRDSWAAFAPDAQAPQEARVCEKLLGNRQTALVRLRVPAIGAELPSRTRAQNEQMILAVLVPEFRPKHGRRLGRRTRIKWCDDASASCDALNQPDPLNAF